MKKTIFISLCFLVSATLTGAYAKKKLNFFYVEELPSVVPYQQCDSAQFVDPETGVPLAKVFYEQDSRGNQTLYELYYCTEGGLVKNEKIVSKYDDKDNLLEIEWYENDDDNEWGKIFKYKYAYDDKGNMITAENYISHNENWIRYSKDEYTFDPTTGNLIKLGMYTTDNNNEWSLYFQKDYIYDGESKKLTQEKHYSKEEDDWVWNIRTDYTYEGNKTIMKVYSGSEENWTQTSENTYEYDKEGNETFYEFYNINSNLKRKTESIYDTNNNLTKKESYVDEGDGWVKYEMITNTYDTENNLITAEYYDIYQLIKKYKKEYAYNIHGNLTAMNIYYADDDDEWMTDPVIKGEIFFSYNQQAGGLSQTETDKKGTIDFTLVFSGTNSFTGSCIVELPDGLELDKENTKLNAALASDYMLTITDKDNNSYELVIAKAESPLRSDGDDDSETVLSIAYIVKEGTAAGTYTALLKDIDLMLNGSPFQLAESEVDIETAGNIDTGINSLSESAIAYIADGVLYINSQAGETVNIYTASGIQLMVVSESAGIALPTDKLPQGVLIVKGNGWSRKVVK